MKQTAYDGNPFGLSPEGAKKIACKAVEMVYTLKAEQDGEECKIIAKDLTDLKVIPYGGGNYERAKQRSV